MTVDFDNEIAYMLTYPDIVWLEYAEPVQAINKDGAECDANRVVKHTVTDCINITRAAISDKAVLETVSDRDLLLDFIAVNWATRVTKHRSCKHPKGCDGHCATLKHKVS